MEREDVTSSDYFGIYREIAEILGIENTEKLHNHFRGQQVVFPMKLYSDEYVCEYVTKNLENKTKTKKELAREFQYTERRISEIVRNCKK